MSIKYISLALNAGAIIVLIAGAIGIASQARFSAKRSTTPSNLVLPQFKAERIKETSEMLVAMDAYERVAGSRVSVSSQMQGLVSLNGNVSTTPENFKSIFVGIDSNPLNSGGSNRLVSLSLPQRSNPIARAPTAQLASKIPASKNSIGTGTLSVVELPKVTVVAVSGQEPRAIINGNLVGVNDQLSGGFVVKQISIDSVVVSQGKEDILIRIPLERLRVLGAQEGVRAKGL